LNRRARATTKKENFDNSDLITSIKFAFIGYFGLELSDNKSTVRTTQKKTIEFVAVT